MKIIAKENIPIELVKELRYSGYDILRVDKVKKGMKDGESLEDKFIVLEEHIIRERNLK
jgi:hypothetical protein